METRFVEVKCIKYSKCVQLSKPSLILALSLAISACVVAPPQPIGYRMTSAVLPTYVNGQYVGMQSSSYVAPVQTAMPVSTATPVENVNPSPQTVIQQAPVHVQAPAPSIVYVQPPAPIYTYSTYYNYTPYVAPTYADSLYGVGVGLGIGLGVSYFSRGCCWRGGWRGGYRRR